MSIAASLHPLSFLLPPPSLLHSSHQSHPYLSCSIPSTSLSFLCLLSLSLPPFHFSLLPLHCLLHSTVLLSPTPLPIFPPSLLYTRSPLSLFSHYTRTTPSLHPHYTLTTPSLHPHYTLTTPSLHPLYTLSTPSLHSHYTLSIPSLHHALSALSLVTLVAQYHYLQVDVQK